VTDGGVEWIAAKCCEGAVIADAALSQFANVNIDVEIDLGHAGLHRTVRTSFMPAAAACTGVADVGEAQASPLRQPAAAFAGELPRQHDFLRRFYWCR